MNEVAIADEVYEAGCGGLNFQEDGLLRLEFGHVPGIPYKKLDFNNVDILKILPIEELKPYVTSCNACLKPHPSQGS